MLLQIFKTAFDFSHEYKALFWNANSESCSNLCNKRESTCNTDIILSLWTKTLQDVAEFPYYLLNQIYAPSLHFLGLGTVSSYISSTPLSHQSSLVSLLQPRYILCLSFKWSDLPLSGLCVNHVISEAWRVKRKRTKLFSPVFTFPGLYIPFAPALELKQFKGSYQMIYLKEDSCFVSQGTVIHVTLGQGASLLFQKLCRSSKEKPHNSTE